MFWVFLHFKTLQKYNKSDVDLVGRDGKEGHRKLYINRNIENVFF